jgi:hypothetical protein
MVVDMEGSQLIKPWKIKLITKGQSRNSKYRTTIPIKVGIKRNAMAY